MLFARCSCCRFHLTTDQVVAPFRFWRDAPSPMPPTEPLPVDSRPHVWPAFVGFGVAFFAIVSVSALVLGVLFVIHLAGSVEQPETIAQILAEFSNFALAPTTLIAAASVSSLTFIGVALVGARLSRTPIAARLRVGRSEWNWGHIALAAFGAVGLSQLCAEFIEVTGLSGFGTLGAFAKAFAHLSPLQLAFALLFIGVTGPLGEEMFFRGFMQTRLSQRWRRLLAIGVTAAAFGLIHMDPIQSPFALILGLYFGWLTESSGSIRPAIAAHALNNCLSVVGTRFAPADVSRSVQIAVMVLSFLFFVSAVAMILLRKPRPPLVSDRAVGG